MVREEGIFSGGSCGSALAGALRYIRTHDLSPDQTVVVLLPDSGSRYLSKIFNDDWMRENRFLESSLTEARADHILRGKAIQKVYTAQPTDRLRDVVSLMKELDISQLPVLDDGKLVGLVTEVELLNHMLFSTHTHSADETIEAMVARDVPTVQVETPMETLMSLFGTARVAVVLDGEPVVGIITKIDLLDFLAGRVN
jgi:cystathionine beta-synthase